MIANRKCFVHLAVGFIWITLSGSFLGASEQETPQPGSVRVIYLDETPLEITRAEFKQLPRTTVTTHDQEGGTIKYGGVLLYHLLERSMTPLGEALRGEALICYVSIEAQDGYRVVFSLPELDTTFSGRTIILADEQDGQPLDTKHGPYRVIVPDEKRHARWVRMVDTIRILESERERKSSTMVKPES